MRSKVDTVFLLIARKTLRVTVRIAIADWVAKRVAPLFFSVSEKLYITHNAGFFSCTSVALNSIVREPPLSVSARFGMRLYKPHLFSDPWSHYFMKPDLTNVKLPKIDQSTPPPLDWWWRKYSELPLSETQLYLLAYFRPSSRVLAKVEEVLDQFDLDYSKIIGVHYRGTDKAQELDTIEVDFYFHELDQILAIEPDHRILLQTDDYAIVGSFLRRYGDRVVIIDHPIKSSEGVGLHYLGKRNPVEDTIQYLSIILILSKCDYLITHTGNGALWEVLYRGSDFRVTQL
jgi:hypothetical protein